MKRIFFAFGCMSLLIVSCTNNEDNKAAPVSDSLTNAAADSQTDLPLSGCYSMIQQKDTATLNLIVQDSNLSGSLQYNRFEKDDNVGVIDGVVRDGLIIANYTFQSEGTSSVREVVFSIKGDSLFEGYGEIIVTADTARFVNSSQLKFMTIPFVKVDCKGQ